MRKPTVTQKLDEALWETFPASDPIAVDPRRRPSHPPAAQVSPGRPAPHLVLPLVGGELWSLHEQSPESFTMLVAYRGLHCSDCAEYLRTLEQLAARFRDRGVEPIAFSMDTRERASEATERWGIESLPVAYGLTEDMARRWGLFVSQRASHDEPPRFLEPGLFLVRPDGTLHYGAIWTLPIGRPDLERLLDAVDDMARAAA